MAEQIPLEPIGSSNLKAIGYDPATTVLVVQFLNGSIFHYAGVPLEVAVAFGGAASKGTFYGTQIRQHYKSERMTGPCKVCEVEGWIGDTCVNCGRGQHVAAVKAERVTCPACSGSGRVAIYQGDDHRRKVVACPDCHGSGAVKAK